MILFKVSMPFNILRTALFVVMITGLTIGVLCFRDFMGVNFFNFAYMDKKMIIIFAVLVVISLIAFLLCTFLVTKIFTNFENKNTKYSIK